MTVTASDPNGGSNTVTVTISVTNVPEPPSAPAAPSVTAGSTTSLNASWSAPANAGKPAIANYDLRYRTGGGDWSNGPQDLPATSATITGLTAGTTYQVQVRATNADGDGDWSPSGSGSTDSSTNNAPLFNDATPSRGVAENTAPGSNVGAAIVATDDDGDTLTYVIGGTDAASFAIDAASGQIRTRTALDFEAKPSYSVTVTASDPNGGSNTVTVTISVTNVPEPPSAPAAPSVTAPSGSTTSLIAIWTPPANTGRPAIANYDLQYRAGTTGNFTPGPQDRAGQTATITGLTAGTPYQVQVRATNADGTGPWSPSGNGRTNTGGGGGGGGDGGDGDGGGGGGGGGGGEPSPPEPDPEPPPPLDPPEAGFSVDGVECPDSLCRVRTGAAVGFRDESSGDVRSLLWDFGDGETSRRRSPDHAWASPGFYRVALTATGASEESTATRTFLVEASAPAGTCTADAETLCLQDSRFSVKMDWLTRDGDAGPGKVVREGTNDSGLFRFFEPANNWEVLVKVLDGCAMNDHLWVFAAATTDLGYEITVTDTLGLDRERTYRNEPGTPARAITDSRAFPNGCQR